MSDTSKKVDDLFKKLMDYLTKKLGTFVAFLFLLYAAGAMTTIVVMQRYPNQVFLVVAIPAIAGIIAYYNRAFASAAFIILLALVFLI